METLHRNVRELGALHAIGQSLNADITVKSVVQAALEGVQAATRADFALFYLKTGGTLQLQGTRPRDVGTEHGHGSVLGAGECLCGATALSGRAIYSSDLENDPRCTRKECKLAGLHSFAALPLLDQKSVIGVLGIAARDMRDFAEQSQFLESIAALVSSGLRNALLYDKLGRHAAELEREVAERKQAEATSRLQAVALDAAANGIMITDRDGKILWVNPAWSAMTGFSAAEAVGKTPRILKSGKHDARFYEQFWRNALSGKVIQGEVVNRRRDGTLYDEQETITPMLDAQGRVTHFVAIKIDITERKRVEMQLREAQRMEAIGRLASGVAHDFNNILSAVMLQAGLLLSEAGLPATRRVEIEQIRVMAERGANLTRQLLLFGRRQAMQRRDMNLNDVVRSSVRMLRRIIGEDVQLEEHLSPAPLLTHADSAMLDQVLLNLVVNARDAMPRGGRLVIRTGELTVRASEPLPHPDASPGDYVSLSVADNGCGIPPDVLPHIFEPFFTTKEAGKGTGLGLATVFGVVKQHEGWLEVESEPGRGTTFRIHLRACAPRAPSRPAEAAEPEPRGGSETILVVEDEEQVRRLTRLILEQHGYRVLEAPRADAALRIWDEQQGRIDLLLTDVVMPGGMSGPELAASLRERAPRLPVLFSSGYCAEMAGRDLVLRPGQTFLQKPATHQELLAMVRRALDDRQG